MSETGFAYETELVDHMSGPAAKAGEGLESLASHAKHAEESLKGLGGVFGEVGKKFSLFGEHGAGSFLKGLVPEIAVAELAVEGVKKIGESAYEIAEKTADIAIEGVKFSLEMAEFKENAIAAYSAVQGTAEEGERSFSEIDKLGRDIHMPAERAHDLAQSLMEQGLTNVQSVEGAIQAVSDLQRTGMDRGASRLQSLIERSLSTGHLELSKRSLAGTGLNVEAIAKELPGQMAEVKAQLKSGQIDAEAGINAIERAFQKSKIHEIAAQKFTLTDIKTDFSNNIRGMFENVNIEPLMTALHDMDWAFEQATNSSGGLRGAVTDAFSTLIQWISPVIDAVTLFGLDAEIGFLKAEIAMKPFLDDLKKMHVDSDVIYYLGEGIGLAAEHMTKLAITTIWLVGTLSQLAQHGSPQGAALGTGFVDGLLLSLQSGQGPVAAAGHNLMGAAVQGAQERAQIHSPSRVTEEMGGQLTEGLTLGIEGGMGDVGAAMGGMVDMRGMGGGGEGGGGSNSTTVEAGAIQVSVHAPQAHATAEEIKEVTTEALNDVLEQLKIELGG